MRLEQGVCHYQSQWTPLQSYACSPHTPLHYKWSWSLTDLQLFVQRVLLGEEGALVRLETRLHLRFLLHQSCQGDRQGVDLLPQGLLQATGNSCLFSPGSFRHDSSCNKIYNHSLDQADLTESRASWLLEGSACGSLVCPSFPSSVSDSSVLLPASVPTPPSPSLSTPSHRASRWAGLCSLFLTPSPVSPVTGTPPPPTPAPPLIACRLASNASFSFNKPLYALTTSVCVCVCVCNYK